MTRGCSCGIRFPPIQPLSINQIIQSWYWSPFCGIKWHIKTTLMQQNEPLCIHQCDKRDNEMSLLCKSVNTYLTYTVAMSPFTSWGNIPSLRYCYEQCKAAAWKQNINLFSFLFYVLQLSYALKGGKTTITLTYTRPFNGPKDTLKTPGISVQMGFEGSMVNLWGTESPSKRLRQHWRICQRKSTVCFGRWRADPHPHTKCRDEEGPRVTREQGCGGICQWGEGFCRGSNWARLTITFHYTDTQAKTKQQAACTVQEANQYKSI